MKKDVLIERYVALLEKWNGSINLVQSKSLDDVIKRHIDDSLQIYDLLDFESKVLDIGSGAGFPGVPLSIMGLSRIVLCEKNLKKSVFLREVRAQLGLDFEIFNADVYSFDRKNYTAVSRAFGSLSLLFDVMSHIQSPKGVFHKGELYEKEIAEAKEFFDFDYVLHESLTNDKSVIIVVSNIRRK